MPSIVLPGFSDVFDKLGRCARCMRLSFALAAGFTLGVMTLLAGDAPAGLLMLVALPAAAFSAWAAAHGVAYRLRGPDRAAGCQSCAERARQRQRKARWQHRLAWLQGGRPAAPRLSGCRTCGQTTPVEAMGEMPRAADGLLHVVERSPEFEALRPRLAAAGAAGPTDSWTADMLHYYLYELQPDADGQLPHAVFIARWEDDVPVSAVVVTPDAHGGPPRNVDLRATSASVTATDHPSTLTSA